MPFKGIPRGSVYIRSTVPCIFGIKHGTPFNKLKIPYKRDEVLICIFIHILER